MKQTLALIFGVIFISLLLAAPVSQSNILLTAENWLEIQSSQSCTVKCYEITSDSLSVPLLYKIDFNPSGYVIISADDSSIPILGYSVSGSILSVSVPARDYLISGYAEQIKIIKNENYGNVATLPIWNSINARTISTRNRNEIGLSTQWGQGPPFWNDCPLDLVNDYRGYVGCVATATSQIVNYFRSYNYTFTDEDDYLSSYHGLEVNIDDEFDTYDFPSFPTLNGLMATVSNKFQNNIQLNDDDIAALCFSCGILSEMQYSSLASSPNDIHGIWPKLNYDARQEVRSMYPVDADWENLIISNMNANRPIEYIAIAAGAGGHAFLIAGYQTTTENTNLFLVNWGWTGAYNDYFAINNLSPTGSYVFNLAQRMVCHIAPKVTVTQSVQFTHVPEYTGLRLKAVDSDGEEQIFNADPNGLFDIQIALGTYDFTIYHTSGNYEPVTVNDVVLQLGTNPISANPIRLVYKKLILVPSDIPTIQEGIDLVSNAGTVYIMNGTYSVSGLHWQDKHIKLLGQSLNGVILNNIGASSQSIRLDWPGIKNQDIIQNINFNNCTLNQFDEGGAAIALFNGAAPTINSCNFNNNSVENSYRFAYPFYSGVGGAVFVGGTINQTETPQFINCNFADNFTSNANGGGAVALNGRASFQACNFLNNRTQYLGGEHPEISNAGGAIIVNVQDNGGDIIFNTCQFVNNKSVFESHDVFVYNCNRLNSLKLLYCTFDWDPIVYHGHLPSIKFLPDSGITGSNQHSYLNMQNNTFNSCDKGAVYFNDYQGSVGFEFTGNIVANNNDNGYGVYLRYFLGEPVNPAFFKFDNNTIKDINGNGLVLYKGTHYTINNSIFENCSSVGINWGEYEPGSPSLITSGLTTKYCIFTHSSPRYNFFGNQNNPLEELEMQIVRSVYLDSNYIPIWNADIKSPCIDNGNPDPNCNGVLWYDEPDCIDKDADESQMDIGARYYYGSGHKNGAIKLEQEETWNWICIPAIDNPGNFRETDHETFVFDGYHNNNLYMNQTNRILNQIKWMYNSDIASIFWQSEFEPYMFVHPTPMHHVRAQYGYKVNLNTDNPDLPEFVPIEYTGFLPGYIGNFVSTIVIEPPDQEGNESGGNFWNPVTNRMERESWIGYYRKNSLDPFDALAPILNNIVSIKAQEWSLHRTIENGQYTNLWLGQITPEADESGLAINYGEMVSVRYIGAEQAEFQWGMTLPLPSDLPRYERPEPSYFTFEKKEDYLPIYATIDMSTYTPENQPVEIAVYVDGKCVGAEKIKGNELQIKAYLETDEMASFHDKVIEFVLKSPDKSENDIIRTFAIQNPLTNLYELRNSIPENCQNYMKVSLKTVDIENAHIPAITTLGNNYPNPFNPETTIRFDLAKTGKSKLEVFNVKGQLIRTLADGNIEAGYHSIKWNGRDDKGKQTSSGVYFYKLTTDGKCLTNKMLMLK